MEEVNPSSRASTESRQQGPALRIDEMQVLLRRPPLEGVDYEIMPLGNVTAANEIVLPLFDGWSRDGELVVRLSGLTNLAFAASLTIDGSPVSTAQEANVGQSSSAFLHFSIELVVPARLLLSRLDTTFKLGINLLPGQRRLQLLHMTLQGIAAPGPWVKNLDLLDVTDTLLFDAPPRHLFDLQSPEEGLWHGSGKADLRLELQWDSPASDRFRLDTRPQRLLHRWQRTGSPADMVFEDATRRVGTDTQTQTEIVFDTGHTDIGQVPAEGKDIPLDLIVEHPLSFGQNSCLLVWRAPLPLRVRDPKVHIKQYERLSAVGIDFGTSSSVAAFHHKGFRALLRLGGEKHDATWENPTYLLIEDHQRLWSELKRCEDGNRFPHLTRIVRASHAAVAELGAFPNSVVGELKSLPERVLVLDQAPQLRDRQQQSDFLLDEPRVRALIRTYAYLLGRAINRPGQDVYLHYWLTHPAKYDKKTAQLLEEEIRAGILLSIPEGIEADRVVVGMRASEPEAFAAEVCPELAADPALEPIISKFGELRFAVFDFGGGTLDIACGRFRPATESELRESGASTVVETLQVGGEDHLGGDYLTKELVWLTHQYEKHLPEMEEKEIPMMRPPTIPPSSTGNKPHLYKRSLAGRQNQVLFERALELEKVKFARNQAPKKLSSLTAVRLDGGQVELHSLGADVPGLHAKLARHLDERIRDGVRLLASLLKNTPWGGEGDWREQGVVLLLAGNSSRSEYVEKALADELGIEGLKVWRPGSNTPFQQVVLYETPERMERGVRVVGVTPKTAVALGALRIANREVHLVRHAQGFSYFLGDFRGFPPKFVALLPMGAPAADPNTMGPHYVDLGTWDGHKPLRVSKEYEPGKMTSHDPRIVAVPTGLPLDAVGKLLVCVTGPERLELWLEREGQEPIRTSLNLAKFVD